MRQASSQGRWQQRIARAKKLSTVYPFAAEILQFYIRILGFQGDVHGESVSGAGRAAFRSDSLWNEIDLVPLLPGFRAFLNLVEQHAPVPLATAARQLSEHDSEAHAELLNTWWVHRPGRNTAGGKVLGASPAENEHWRFCARAFLEPYAEYLGWHSDAVVIESAPSVCPLCGSRPLLGVLRPEGDGSKRFLQCAFCLQEWAYRRILCPACGEEAENKLPVYVAEQFPHIRVEACDSCRHFLRTVDLTKDGNAVPIVDDLGAIPLGLWADEHGYTRIYGNLLGT